ncbi:hypothetical protein SLS62_003584 [Diatrype stigma]|uniref:Uncharacterized protein n=1 Tax=Diatrype stigma TaxID=117547 RepID=A0AAN9YPX5_9PEZI
MPADQGRESPPPESQSGAQLKDTPGSGQGTDQAPDKTNKLNDQLKGLSSNPKGAIDDAVEQKFSKTQNPSTNKDN